MSKRGSKNAISFAGKNWKVGRKFKMKKSPRDERNEKRDNRKKSKLDLICKKFNFKISDLEDQKWYNSMLEEFLKLRAMKGSRIARKSINNVDYFKAYCEKYGEEFDIKIYFDKKYNKMDFKTKYPKLQLSKSLVKNEKQKKIFPKD